MNYAKGWKEFVKFHRETMERAQVDVLTATQEADTIEKAAKAFVEVSARWQQCQIYEGLIQQIDQSIKDSEGDD